MCLCIVLFFHTRMLIFIYISVRLCSCIFTGTNDGKNRFESNRFTLPNNNEKFRFNTTVTMFWLRASLCCKIASWLTFASMSPLCSAKAISSSVAMRASQSWLRWTGPAASGPESRTLGVDCVGGSDRATNRIKLNRIDSFVALNRIESNRFLFCQIAHH